MGTATRSSMFLPVACSCTHCNYVKEMCEGAKQQGATTRPVRLLHMSAGAGPASPAAQERRGAQGWLRNKKCLQLSSAQGYKFF